MSFTISARVKEEVCCIKIKQFFLETFNFVIVFCNGKPRNGYDVIILHCWARLRPAGPLYPTCHWIIGFNVGGRLRTYVGSWRVEKRRRCDFWQIRSSHNTMLSFLTILSLSQSTCLFRGKVMWGRKWKERKRLARFDYVADIYHLLRWMIRK